MRIAEFGLERPASSIFTRFDRTLKSKISCVSSTLERCSRNGTQSRECSVLPNLTYNVVSTSFVIREPFYDVLLRFAFPEPISDKRDEGNRVSYGKTNQISALLSRGSNDSIA